MAPGVGMDLVEPFHTFLVFGRFVSSKQSDHGLDMNPPQFLIPLKLLRRTTFDIFEVVDPSVFVVPGVLNCAQEDACAFLFKEDVLEALREIQQEPDGLVAVACIDDSAFVTVHELTFGADVLEQEVVFFVEELGQNFRY
jgi:hypothetical protein